MKCWLGLVLSLILLFSSPTAWAQTTLLVDGQDGLAIAQGATGADWAHAYLYLQDGIDDALANATQIDPYQIWVRGSSNGGITYRPDLGDLANHRIDDPLESFQLHDHVALYAGFVGTESSTEFNLRAPYANLTILSGGGGSPNPPQG